MCAGTGGELGVKFLKLEEKIPTVSVREIEGLESLAEKKMFVQFMGGKSLNLSCKGQRMLY